MLVDAFQNRQVPVGFPDSVRVYYTVTEGTETRKFQGISNQYRRDAKNNKAMQFFVENVLARINPKKSNFQALRTKLKLSEIYTITDEAFALAMVLNQGQIWEELTKSEDKREKAKMKKLFTAPQSGGRQSWSAEGRSIFYSICRAVKTLRADKISGDKFESDLEEYYKSVCPRYRSEQQKLRQKAEQEKASLMQCQEFFDADGIDDILGESDINEDEDEENSFVEET